MKSDKKLMLLTLGILILGVACSTSDDDDSDTDGNNSENNESNESSDNTTNYRVSSYSDYTSDGNLTDRFSFSYNSDGSLASMTAEEYDASTGDVINSKYTRLVYEYGANGFVAKELWYDSSDDNERNVTYEYDSSNRIIGSIESYGSGADNKTQYLYNGDSEKPAYEELDLKSDREVDYNTTYIYDENTNNVISENSDTDMDGVVDYLREYSYNASNQYISRKEYSPLEDSPSFDIETISYDANGQRTREEASYGDDEGTISWYRTYTYEVGSCGASTWVFFEELSSGWCL